MHTYKETYAATREYFNGDRLATETWVNKYALTKDRITYDELTPDDMHRRMAKEFARMDAKYPNPMDEEEIYNLFKDFKYIVPQGSPMSAIGNPYRLQSAGNCFVLAAPFDSYGGICYNDQQQVQIMKRRGGVGFDISTIRPRGMDTANAAQTTDGIGVFMERYSNSTREVAQGGRRGALMLSISIHHPEVRTFVKIKQNKEKVTGANCSVRLSDEFMEAVDKGEKFQLRWPVDEREAPEMEEWVDARGLWDDIIYSAWDSAEPGLLLWDNIIKNSPADCYADEDDAFKTVSTNPCGEIPMGRDSCRLLLVNLLSFVKKPFTKQAEFDWDKYGEVVQKAQRLMDDLVDLELEIIDKIIAKVDADPEPDRVKAIERDMWVEFRRTCELGRRTGLGITALGDTLAALGVQYGSDYSIQVAEDIYKRLCLDSFRSSCIMAKERGAFPLHDHEKEADNPYLQRIWKADPKILKMCKEHGRRNVALTTTAPAGSVSILTQTTNGIEPLFLTRYTRRRKLNDFESIEPDFVDKLGDKWAEYDVTHVPWTRWQEVFGQTDIEESPYWEATANDINWVNKVKIQAAAQKWICHAISNTTNVPKDTTIDTIKDIYLEGWKSGCKGVTVYRDGCRTGVMISQDENSMVRSFVFVLEDGSCLQVQDDEEIEYGGEVYRAAELFQMIHAA